MAKKNKDSKSKSIHNEAGQAAQLARMGIAPSANAAMVIHDYCTSFGKQDAQALVDKLADSIDKIVNEEDTRKCEAMLMAQAEALQAIFVNLSRSAIKQEYVKNLNIFLKLALKAQGQCRATLETIAVIKNPPIVYARQANIAQGHQQINNGVLPVSASSPAEKNKNDQNELLEVQHEQRLDFGTPKTTGAIDQTMATVEAVHRSENTGR